MNYTIKNDRLAVTISSRGAEMQSVIYQGQEYLWQGDPAYWTDHSPLLFPFVGRFTDGHYTLHGKQYDMNIHGFANCSEFSVKELSDTALTLEITDTPDTMKIYPFRHICISGQSDLHFLSGGKSVRWHNVFRHRRTSGLSGATG